MTSLSFSIPPFVGSSAVGITAKLGSLEAIVRDVSGEGYKVRDERLQWVCRSKFGRPVWAPSFFDSTKHKVPLAASDKNAVDVGSAKISGVGKDPGGKIRICLNPPSNSRHPEGLRLV